MRSSEYFHQEDDSESSSQNSDTESNDPLDNESLGDDFLAGHGNNKGFTALIVHKDFGFVGKIPGAIFGLIHETLQLILRPEHLIEVKKKTRPLLGMWWLHALCCSHGIPHWTRHWGQKKKLGRLVKNPKFRFFLFLVKCFRNWPKITLLP